MHTVCSGSRQPRRPISATLLLRCIIKVDTQRLAITELLRRRGDLQPRRSTRYAVFLSDNIAFVRCNLLNHLRFVTCSYERRLKNHLTYFLDRWTSTADRCLARLTLTETAMYRVVQRAFRYLTVWAWLTL